jgi:hypothetical protein
MNLRYKQSIGNLQINLDAARADPKKVFTLKNHPHSITDRY